MRIGWIADNFFPLVQRGAEIEDNILITEGEHRGHEIIRIGAMVKDVDLYIVANFIDTFNHGELMAYLSRRPYVNIEHDLRGPQYAFYPTFARDAEINVYHSPFQRAHIEKFSGTFKNFLHPMCLPPQYSDLKLKRRAESQVLFVGDYSWEKGYRELVEWSSENPRARIWHYGGGFEIEHPKMKEMGITGQDEMPIVYNQFKRLIFIPHYPQACSRVMAEAYLCKVPEVIGNGKDGFSSYGWKIEEYDRVRDILVNGHIHFWNKLEDEGIVK